jgi:hypothetical protein
MLEAEASLAQKQWVASVKVELSASSPPASTPTVEPILSASREVLLVSSVLVSSSPKGRRVSSRRELSLAVPKQGAQTQDALEVVL